MVEPADHAIGLFHGAATTKIHALADGRGWLVVALLTGGNFHDSTMFAPLRVARPGPGWPRSRPDHLLADKGYSSKGNRRLLRARGIAHTIPEKADQVAHPGPRQSQNRGFDLR